LVHSGKSVYIPRIAFLLNNLAKSLLHRVRKRRKRSLHPDLDSLKRTKRKISQELSTRTTGQEDSRLIGIGEQLLAIGVFEHLIEPIFSTTLETISHERGGPAEKHPAQALDLVDGFPGAEVGFIEVGIDLAAAFYEIEGCNGCVGWAAGWRLLLAGLSVGVEGELRTNYPTKTAGCKVFAAVELDLRLWEGFLEGRHRDSCSVARSTVVVPFRVKLVGM
jgi:hypothetical protein